MDPVSWLIPILASVLGGAATAGVSSALAPDVPKPQAQFKSLGISNDAMASSPAIAQNMDPMAEDALQRYLAGAMQRKGM